MGSSDSSYYYEEIRVLRNLLEQKQVALEHAERKGDYKDAKWYQIHTNGATTTFARYYASPDSTGEFEKMQVDLVNGTAEMFGAEHYHDWQDAKTRVRVAVWRGE